MENEQIYFACLIWETNKKECKTLYTDIYLKPIVVYLRGKWTFFKYEKEIPIRKFLLVPQIISLLIFFSFLLKIKQRKNVFLPSLLISTLAFSLNFSCSLLSLHIKNTANINCWRVSNINQILVYLIFKVLIVPT